MNQEVVEYTYVAPDAPQFQCRITVNGEDHQVKFANGSLTLTGEVAEEFDRQLHKPNSALARYVRKVDRELGEKIAKAHMEEYGQRAAKGPFSTNSRQEMLAKTLAERQASMQRITTPEEAAKFSERLAGGDMAMQEVVDPRAGQTALEDAIPVGEPQANAEEAAAAETSLATEEATPAKKPFSLQKKK